MACKHEINDIEVGYDLRTNTAEYFCTKCGQKAREVKMSRADWNKKYPEMKIPTNAIPEKVHLG